MKRYFRMKYEQFMIRLFDWLLRIFQKNERLSWYPKSLLGNEDRVFELEDKIMTLERELDQYETVLLRKDQRIDDLEEKLYFYEPWEEESE